MGNEALDDRSAVMVSLLRVRQFRKLTAGCCSPATARRIAEVEPDGGVCVNQADGVESVLYAGHKGASFSLRDRHR